ncbi:hypothetical protein D3C85_1316760 [compost metagenome]
MCGDRGHRRVGGIHQRYQPALGNALQVGGQAADVVRAAYYRHADAMVAGRCAGEFERAADAVGTQYVVAVVECRRGTFREDLEAGCIDAGMAFLEALEVAVDQIDAVGRMAQEIAFDQSAADH